jgi:hypothetical protein
MNAGVWKLLWRPAGKDCRARQNAHTSDRATRLAERANARDEDIRFKLMQLKMDGAWSRLRLSHQR